MVVVWCVLSMAQDQKVTFAFTFLSIFALMCPSQAVCIQLYYD